MKPSIDSFESRVTLDVDGQKVVEGDFQFAMVK